MTPKVKQQAGRFLGLGRSGEDRALVRFEDLEPGRDVAGVMVEVGDRKTQFCPENGRGKLGDQFLGSIGVAAEAVPRDVRLGDPLHDVHRRARRPVRQELRPVVGGVRVRVRHSPATCMVNGVVPHHVIMTTVQRNVRLNAIDVGTTMNVMNAVILAVLARMLLTVSIRIRIHVAKIVALQKLPPLLARMKTTVAILVHVMKIVALPKRLLLHLDILNRSCVGTGTPTQRRTRVGKAPPALTRTVATSCATQTQASCCIHQSLNLAPGKRQSLNLAVIGRRNVVIFSPKGSVRTVRYVSSRMAAASCDRKGVHRQELLIRPVRRAETMFRASAND